MNGIVPGTIITHTAAPWETGLLIANVVVGLLVLAGIIMIVHRLRKEDAPSAAA